MRFAKIISVLVACLVAWPATAFASVPTPPPPNPGPGAWAAWDSAMTQYFFDLYVNETFTAAEVQAMRARGIVDQSTFAAKATLSEAQRVAAKGVGMKPGQWLFQTTATRDGVVGSGVHRQAVKALPWSKNVTAGGLFKFAGQISILAGVGQAADAFGETLFGRATYYHADGTECTAYGSGMIPCAHPNADHFMHRPAGWLRDGVSEFAMFPPWSIEAEGIAGYEWEDTGAVAYPPVMPTDPERGWPMGISFAKPPFPPTSYGTYVNQFWNDDAAALVQYAEDAMNGSMPIVPRFGYSAPPFPTAAYSRFVNLVTGELSPSLSANYFHYPEIQQSNSGVVGPAADWRTGPVTTAAMLAWYEDQMAQMIDQGLVTMILEEDTEIPGVPAQMPDERQMPAVLTIPSDVHEQLTDPDPDNDPIAADVLERVTVPDTLPDPVEEVTGVDEDDNRWTGKTAPLLGALKGEFASRWPFAGGAVLSQVWADAQSGSGDPMTWQIDFNPFSGAGAPGIGLFKERAVHTIDPKQWLGWLSGYRWVLVGAMAASAIAALMALLRPRVDV